MLATLDTPYADSRPDALSFALGLAPLDALAVLPVARGGLTVELRLLGASHQVIAGPLSETVACLPERPGPLPGRVSTELPGWAYDFTATTETHDGAAAFGRAVDALRARLGDRGDALTGTFPGSPHAVTALAVEPSGTGWRTWHAYPQTMEIVMTRSRLVSQP
ncbi:MULTISPECIES: DUF2617 family protein [Thermomonosporaceae]|uniref:DUF2617 family protein n=1 Tax=Thermomonosporaceae TaxID=2012 RepID=UPI00255ABF36|nr:MULTISPECIES: DUF2617 family protein [Thermomonosporaceae]MDL4772141.1 DUF2617 family protein [Actinomadura xylanilytica]